MPIVTTRFHGTIASDASSSLKLIARSSRAACASVRWPLSADESTIRSSSGCVHEVVQFLDRLDADEAQQPVGRAVEQTDQRRGEPHVQPHRRRERAGDRLGLGDRQVLRCQLAEHHLRRRGQHERRARTRRRTTPTPGGRPRSAAGSISPAIAGSAMKPSTSVVTVMPSCAPDSMKLSRLCTSSARRDLRSVSADSLNFERRAATNANSPATKYPLAAIRTTNGQDSERIQHGVNFVVGRRTWPRSMLTGTRAASARCESTVRSPGGCGASGTGRASARSRIDERDDGDVGIWRRRAVSMQSIAAEHGERGVDEPPVRTADPRPSRVAGDLVARHR